MEKKFDCVIIGGGATGAGTARDLSIRGFSVALFEKEDLANGTTGRCHAMLHSGARYVEKDKEAAMECRDENRILLKIAPHITEACGGHFLAINDFDLEYAPKFVANCKSCGISIEEISVQDFLRQEPQCNRNTKLVYKVKDAYIDPFLLAIYNAHDARLHGAKIYTYHVVEHLLIRDRTVVGVQVRDRLTNQVYEVYADIVVNATGPWASILEKDLQIEKPISISPTKGTLLVVRKRLVNSLINRLRPPGDGDIIVPSHQSVLVGTTSIPVDISSLDTLLPSTEEIECILNESSALIPSIRDYRVVRFYAGARPLIEGDSSMSKASRKFAIRDYKEEGYSGYITIIGGKLTTYRLMAEKISDYICKYFGTVIPCSTHLSPLPGGEYQVKIEEYKNALHIDSSVAYEMTTKWGTFYSDFLKMYQNCIGDRCSDDNSDGRKIICECEKVTEQELDWVRDTLGIRVLDDYRRRTRQGMGPCQGQFCYFKMANLEAKKTQKSFEEIISELKQALEKRWKTEPVADRILKRQIKIAKYMYRMGGNL
jgi:glycerol-3-phosphate dehydrogenase